MMKDEHEGKVSRMVMGIELCWRCADDCVKYAVLLDAPLALL